jgi:hypothetical protein
MALYIDTNGFAQKYYLHCLWRTLEFSPYKKHTVHLDMFQILRLLQSRIYPSVFLQTVLRISITNHGIFQ